MVVWLEVLEKPLGRREVFAGSLFLQLEAVLVVLGWGQRGEVLLVTAPPHSWCTKLGSFSRNSVKECAFLGHPQSSQMNSSQSKEDEQGGDICH